MVDFLESTTKLLGKPALAKVSLSLSPRCFALPYTNILFHLVVRTPG